MKKIVILATVVLLASFLLYGVVSDDTKYSPVGYNLKWTFQVKKYLLLWRMFKND